MTSNHDTSTSQLVPVFAGQMQDPCLIRIHPSGTDLGRRVLLTADKVTIGRDESCILVLNDGSVSRQHALLVRSDDGLYLFDKNSTNGTFVNDHPISGTCKLNDGDYIRFGNIIFRFLASGNIEADYHEELYRLTIQDGLTQLSNRRYFNEFLEREFSRAVRYKRHLSVLLFDIDHFKTINDQYGHICGDHILRTLSARVRATIRAEDLLARYGGEEFCCVCVETNLHQALLAAERIRQLIGNTPFTFQNHLIPVTVSMGVATTHAGINSEHQLLHEADRHLYQAKSSGRNCIVGS